MFCRFFSILLALAGILIASVAAAGPATDAGKGSVVKDAGAYSFEGTLVVREADGVFLVRSDQGVKKRFACRPNTGITRNGHPASYHDLHSRDRIRVQYDANFVVTAIQASGS